MHPTAPMDNHAQHAARIAAQAHRVFPYPILRIHLTPSMPCFPLTYPGHNWQILSKMGKNKKLNRPSANFPSNPFHLKGLILEVERLFAKESFGELK
jgi:hypothetical protein